MWTLPLGAILSAATALLVYVFHVPQYEASTLVLIESSRPYIAFEDRTEERSADKFVQTQIEMMQSPWVLEKVLGRPEIASIKELRGETDPVAYLRKHLRVKQVGKSELHDVIYTGPCAADAATIANSTVAEYLRLQQEEDKERADIVIGVLAGERDKRTERIKDLREKVVKLSKELTGKDPFGSGAITDLNRATLPASSLFQSLSETEVDAEVLSAEIQALHNAPSVERESAVKSGVVELELSNRPEIRELEAKIATLDQRIAERRSQLVEISRVPPEQNPEYRLLTDQSAQSKRELLKLKENLRNQMLEVLKAQRKTEVEQQIATKSQQLAVLNGKRTLLSDKLAAQMEELKKGGANSVELQFKKAELDREEKIYDLIASRTLALQTEARAPARVWRKQSAAVPALAIEPVPYKLLLLACLAAFGMPTALAIGAEALLPRICTSEQLADVSELPVIGEVARLPVQQVQRSRTRLVTRQQRDQYIFSESIDSLRTNLVLAEHLGSNGQRKVVAICSAASGEGKTCVASHLAVSIAEASRQPTLLIDGDLRSPDVATFFGAQPQPGIAEILADNVPISEAIQRIDKSNVYILPAGKLRVSPHQLLSSQAVEALLSRLQEKFLTIVVDTPPILGASEALVYAKAADVVVFCSLAESSRERQVRLGVHRLRSIDARIAGMVLSGIPVSKYVYNYGSYEYSPVKQ